MVAEKTSDDTTVNVVRRGEGMPVVALHGVGVDHRLLLALDDALAGSGGLERVYLDLPGFGQTPALPEPGGLPELADWVLAEVDRLTDGREFALVGNSLGGLLARHVAAKRRDRVRGLALLAPVMDPDEDARTVPDLEVVERDDEFMTGVPEDGRDEFVSMAARQTRQTWTDFAEHVLPGVHATDSDAQERLTDRYELPDPDTGLDGFAGPVLVVTGRQDHLVGHVDQRALVERCPHATYAALDGAGHNVHVDQPEVTRALLREWASALTR